MLRDRAPRRKNAAPRVDLGRLRRYAPGVRRLVPVLAFLVACDDAPSGGAPPAGPWTPPTAKSPAVACADLAQREGHQTIAGPSLVVEQGPLAVGDASALGGPATPPIRVAIPRGTYETRLVVGGGATRCLEVIVAPGTVTAWEEAGDVVVDTDTVLLVDEVRAREARRRREDRIDVTFEADAATLPRVIAALEKRGRTVERLSPTLARASGPTPPDADVVRDVLRTEGAYGRVHREPDMQGLAGILALGEKPFAPFGDGGVVVDASGGYRSTRVRVGKDGSRIVRVEWSGP